MLKLRKYTFSFLLNVENLCGVACGRERKFFGKVLVTFFRWYIYHVSCLKRVFFLFHIRKKNLIWNPIRLEIISQYYTKFTQFFFCSHQEEKVFKKVLFWKIIVREKKRKKRFFFLQELSLWRGALESKSISCFLLQNIRVRSREKLIHLHFLKERKKQEKVRERAEECQCVFNESVAKQSTCN